MMMKLIFGLLVGAVLVYLFDPRQGQERREMLTDLLRRGRDVADHRDDVIQAGRETVTEARDRAQTASGHAQERVGQTLNDARDRVSEMASEVRVHARELNDTTQDRARVALDGNKS